MKALDDFKKQFKSKALVDKIEDDGMWGFIPEVDYSINSKKGVERLKENELLFKFIDDFFTDDKYAFEPNMQDGRYMFLPDDVGHQGIGACVSLSFPGFIEVGHFWYPCEFTEKDVTVGGAQVYVPIFSARPGKELADLLRSVYMLENDTYHKGSYCTFPFDAELIVKLESYFLDKMNKSVKIIRDAVKDRSEQTRRNAEGLIGFMQRIVKDKKDST